MRETGVRPPRRCIIRTNPIRARFPEVAAQALLEDGVNISVIRLPQVHDRAKQGLISPYIDISREKGSVAYVGDGSNRWPAAHVLDVAKVYALALDHCEAGRDIMPLRKKALPRARLPRW